MSRSMTFVMVVVLLAASVLVPGSSYSVSAQEDVRTFEIPNRISFSYSMQIAQDVSWQVVPASHDFQTPTGPIPEYTELTFQNYEDGTGWVSTGQFIHVYPVIPFPTDPDAPYAVALDRLHSVLAARPAIPDGDLPMLPTVTASQMIRSQVQYLDFATGSGIRYVTAAGLDVSPVDGVLFYTFQGLTGDGAYYIAAQFPVQSSVLPASEPMNTEQYNAFVASFDVYLADVTAQLNAAPAQSFSPDLTVLDNVFASMSITGPARMILTPEGADKATVAFDNILFTYDAALASRIDVDVIPPFDDPGGMSMFGSQPGATVFSFIDYPVTRPYGNAVIRVIPVDTFPGTNTMSDQALARLQAFLAAQTPLEAHVNVKPAGESNPGIPVLPVINAAQVIVVKPEYMAFQNWNGVRFITYYAQDLSPLTNGTIFYAFQGITMDGRYVISAEFPLRVPMLPDSIDYSAIDWDTFAANYGTYLDETVTALDNAASGDYTPSLDTLDALLQSLSVGQ